ncbi:MAG: 3-hydroxyacyl-CoA dehydrogenase/enoyl-CoA hydratase family protein [Beijerinckiaceae bacterium]|nr:MAG: 3-hydroxyacyl-CoA dehydrogenase/enoyl-CoA hydratase family protein [Beijerinckiaceae bacterium]
MDGVAPLGINSVGIIGAGVMGAGIAAQAANAGAKVLLVDVASEGSASRNAIAEAARTRLAKSEPAALMHPGFLSRIATGNIEDDLGRLAECDWIIEAVVEKAEVKRAIYRRLEPVLRPGVAVSSNTSTVPLAALTEGLPERFRRAFLITHFFNPPRYMRLLEVVAGPDSDPETVARVSAFADRALGKSVIQCKDTPGFIANRIGTFWLHAALIEAVRRGIGVEAADAVLGRPAGVPKTGVFGLLDLIGLDLLPHVLTSLRAALPADDALLGLGPAPELVGRLIAAGATGRKGTGGFYRLKDGAKEVIDLATGDYALARRPVPPAAKAARRGGLRALLAHSSHEGRFAFAVLSATLAYAAKVMPDIAADAEAVDRAMRLGYGWKQGPFEMIDALGAGWLAERLRAEGRTVPPALADGRPFYRTDAGRLSVLDRNGAYRAVERPPGVLLLADVKRAGPPLAANRSASLWDLGDGVACLEFHSKMNALDPWSLAMANRAVRMLPAKGFKGLVVHNDGANFSVGANIALLRVAAALRLWPAIGWLLRRGQTVFSRLKLAPFPVVGAPSGLALGGGCEVLLHCDALVVHAETYIGLVETAVGIVPSWGGCAALLAQLATAPERQGGPMPPVIKAFEAIATAKVSKSAEEARDLGFLRFSDSIVMNRDRVLAEAKARVLAMAKGYAPSPPVKLALPGPSGEAALELAVRDYARKGVASPHDVTVAGELAHVLTGGSSADVIVPVDEKTVRDLERAAVLRLARTPQTRARVAHMLKTGKPLRN